MLHADEAAVGTMALALVTRKDLAKTMLLAQGCRGLQPLGNPGIDAQIAATHRPVWRAFVVVTRLGVVCPPAGRQNDLFGLC